MSTCASATTEPGDRMRLAPKADRSSHSARCLRGHSIRGYVRKTDHLLECGPRLSLCQRERMKVRDCSSVAARVRTRLLATRFRALLEVDHSKNATQQLRGQLGFRSYSIANLAHTVAMSSNIQFDSQFCARTIKIYDVTAARMLASKFVSCEIPVP